MAKSKYAPALFEVIDSHSKGKKKAGLALPKWWKSSTKEADAAAESKDETKASTSPEVRESSDSDAGSRMATGARISTGDRTAKGDRAQTSSTQEASVSQPGVSEQVSTSRAASPSGTAQGSEAVAEGHTGSVVSRTGAWLGAIGGSRTAGRRGTGGAGPSNGTAPGHSSVRAEEGLVVFSLTPIHLILVCGGLVLALFTSYMIGRTVQGSPAGTGEQASTEDVFDIESARRSEADPSVLGGVADDRGQRSGAGGSEGVASAGQSSADASGTQLTRSGRQTGLNYIVLQYFNQADREEAMRAKEWLATRGVETTLERSTVRNGWLLISIRGFDYDTADGKQRAEAYRDAIKALGPEYRNDYRDKFGTPANYWFHDPMIRKEP